MLLAQQAQAAVPPAVANATFHATAKLAAGQALTTLGASAGAISAFKGVLRTMLISKLNLLFVAFLAIGLVTGVLSFVLSAGAVPPVKDVAAQSTAQDAAAEDAGAKENPLAKHLQSRSWTLKGRNVTNRTITIWDRPAGGNGFQLIFGNPNPVPRRRPIKKGALLEGLQLAEEAKVLIDGRPAKLADLKEGMTLLLKVAAGKTRITAIEVITKAREDQYFVEAIHLKQNSITGPGQ